MTKDTTIKKRLYAKAVIENGGELMSSLEATYPDEVAGMDEEQREAKARSLMQDKIVKTQIARILDKQGIGLTTLTGKLKRMLEAEKVIIVDNQIHMVPDNNVQASMLRMAFQLHGELKNTIETNIDNRRQSIIVNDETLSQLEPIVEKLREFKTSLTQSIGKQNGEVVIDVESK